jgi:cellulose synthase/poly-beta-1,6-N-acetylglucosamine synthase-like glycosyltransferase
MSDAFLSNESFLVVIFDVFKISAHSMAFALAAFVFIVSAFLAALSIAACVQRIRTRLLSWHPHPLTSMPPAQGHLCFVVPAHNEEKDIGKAVASLLSQNDVDFSVHVIADNCTDATAEQARMAGAEVWERFDDARRSKGYALEWALPRVLDWAKLHRTQACFIAIVDADASLSQSSTPLARVAFAHGKTILQSEYLLVPGAHLSARVASVGFAAMNVARGLGRRLLGLSDFLKGNGMWFRVDVIARHPWRAYSLAEDLEHSIHLLAQGERVELLEGSVILGEPARTSKGLADQRVRWEGGRLALVFAAFPAALKRVLRHPSLAHANVVLELATPPLALLTLLSTLLCFVPGTVGLISISGLALLFIHVVLAVPAARLPSSTYGALAFAPLYIAWKILLIPATWKKRRSKGWVRAARVIIASLLCTGAISTRAKASPSFSIPANDSPGKTANRSVFCVGYGPWIPNPDYAALAPTLVRWGGNTSSRFNLRAGNLWSAGKDYRYLNISGGSPDVARSFVKEVLKMGAEVQFSIPILGWVAKDGTSAGNPKTREPRTTSIPLEDSDVENWVRSFKAAASSQRRVYPLDNEPFLWHSTHGDVIFEKQEPSSFAKRWLHYARLVRRVDPQAVMTGPGLWGYGDLNNLPDFLDATIDKKDASGVPLLGIVNINAYPQNQELQDALVDITGRNEKTTEAGKVPKAQTERLRAETALNFSDEAYIDPSWVNKPLRLVARVREAIVKAGNRTQVPARMLPSIAITEYNWGAPQDPSGAVAQGALLLAFLREDLDHACSFTWPPPNSRAGFVFRALRDTFAPTNERDAPRVLQHPPPFKGSLWAEQNGTLFLYVATGAEPLNIPKDLFLRVKEVMRISETSATFVSYAAQSLLSTKDNRKKALGGVTLAPMGVYRLAFESKANK